MQKLLKSKFKSSLARSDLARLNHLLILFSVIILAAFFRLYGLNWDQSQHLHPDERFLTMVVGGISWPMDISEYLDTNTSPLNPHNRGFNFFVYGTFPLFFTKFVAESLRFGDYTNLTLVGRVLSAMFDLGTVLLVFLIGRKIKGDRLGLLAALLYSLSVLPIQLSHFFAVDTYLTFFLTLTVYLLIPPTSQILMLSTLSGLSFSLALASKISAILFVPVIALSYLCRFSLTRPGLARLLFGILLFLGAGYLTFRIAQPYAFSNTSLFSFSPNPKFIENLTQLKNMAVPGSSFPPAVQWEKTKPVAYSLKNLLLWGLGVPLGSTALAGLIFVNLQTVRQLLFNLKRPKDLSPETVILGVLLVATLVTFTYQSIQFAKPMRYLLPIYPFLTILSANFLLSTYKALSKTRTKRTFLLITYHLSLITFLIWPLSFITIYTRPHSRVAASEWIYQNIPAGSKLAYEHWDDPLPLNLPQNFSSIYQGIEFPLYGDDTPEKWANINKKISEVDYIILSSNRLYGALMTDPQKYPITYKYYSSLFDGSLGFVKMAEFTSRPNLPIPGLQVCITPPGARYGIIAKQSQECPLKGLSIVDDYADETYTVYDHPKVLIFRNTDKFSQMQISSIINI